MPRRACPHCPEGFINQSLLERHIRFVHSDLQATAPAPPSISQLSSRSTGYLAMISANPAPTPPSSDVVENHDRNDSVGLSQPREARLPEEGRFRLRGVPDVPAPGAPRFTPSMESTMGILGPLPTTEQGREPNGIAIATPETRALLPEPVPNPRPTPSAPLARRTSQHGSVRFTVVYVAEAQNFSRTLHLPNTTPWPSFLDELAVASTPVAQRYISGTSDGFRLGDGAWRFSLVDNRGEVEGRWRPLSRILFYQAMISELLKPDSPWKHAQVWHVSQSSTGSQRHRRRALTVSPGGPVGRDSALRATERTRITAGVKSAHSCVIPGTTIRLCQ